jgi:dihydrofolate reductase
MKKPIVSIIAAIGTNQELGKNNKLLWHIPQDFARFKKITLSHPVIMGRTTFCSIGKPLPGRVNIVVTRDKNFKADRVIICHSLEEAIDKAKRKDNKEIFVIGGGQIYEQAIKFADKLYLTLVKGNFDADTFFPDYSQFTKVVYKKEGQDDNYRYTFLELVKEKY